MPGNIATPPASITSSWPAPNYADPLTRGWLVPVASTLHAVSTLFVFIRLWLRSRKTVGGLGLDDALLGPAWIFATAVTALVCRSSTRGLSDRHIWDVPPDRFSESALTGWLVQFFFLLGTCCLKVSVLLFCYRMVSGSSQRRWRVAIAAAIALTVAYSFALIVVLICNCNPTSAYWKAFDREWASSHDYECSDTRALNPLAGALAIASDIYSIVIPCAVCWNLKLSLRQRIGLNALFCASIMAVGAAGGRTWAIYRVGQDYDASWHAIWVYFWGCFEYELGIICTCIPTFRALFRHERLSTKGSILMNLRSGQKCYTPGSWSKSIQLDPWPSRAQEGKSCHAENGGEIRLASPTVDGSKRTTVVSMHSRGDSWLELDDDD